MEDYLADIKQRAGRKRPKPNDPFIGVPYQKSCVSDIYIVIHNGSKISYEVVTR